MPFLVEKHAVGPRLGDKSAPPVIEVKHIWLTQLKETDPARFEEERSVEAGR